MQQYLTAMSARAPLLATTGRPLTIASTVASAILRRGVDLRRILRRYLYRIMRH